MPYDPTFPATSVPLVSAEFRAQFNALKALIDAQAAQIAALQSDLADRTTAADVIAASAGPVTGIAPANVDYSDPPTATEVQDLAIKVDEVLQALKRE